MKVSGLYSRTNSVSRLLGSELLDEGDALDGKALTSSLLIPNTVSRNTGEVAL